MESPVPRYQHSLPRYQFEGDRYRGQQERALINVDKVVAPMGPARSLIVDDRFPKGYDFYERNVLLLNGDQVPVYYSIAKNNNPSVRGFERSRGAIIAAFMWILETPSFADNDRPSSEERSEEIGTILSAAIAYGLREEEALICYNTAYLEARQNIDN